TVTRVSDSLVGGCWSAMSKAAFRVVRRRGAVASRRPQLVSGGGAGRRRRSPRLLPPVEQERICAARRRSGWGPRLIAGELGHPHATVWRTLRRAGISRPPRQPRERPRLYEWPC